MKINMNTSKKNVQEENIASLTQPDTWQMCCTIFGCLSQQVENTWLTKATLLYLFLFLNPIHETLLHGDKNLNAIINVISTSFGKHDINQGSNLSLGKKAFVHPNKGKLNERGLSQQETYTNQD